MNKDNNSERPKRPRIKREGGSENSRPSNRNTFDTRNKYEKGDLKWEKKPHNKFEGNRDENSGRGNFEKKPYTRFDRNDDKFGKGSYEKKPYSRFDNKDDKYGKASYEKKPYQKFDDRDKKFGKSDFDRKPRRRLDEINEDKARAYVQKRKLEKIEQSIHKDTIRLNKYIANSGICSRREADILIKQGLVEVNGKVISEMGYQVQKTDKVVFDGQAITPEKPVYVLLNKPKGFISTTNDEKMRKTVMDLVANASPYRLFPVGRLDRSTTGVILLTNDGHLTKKLTHPSFEVRKIYHVTLDRKLSYEDMQTIVDGIRMEEGVARVDKISYIEGKPKNEVGVELHIGWNRIIRRIFQKLGYEVTGLDRVMFAGLSKKNVKRGEWRILTEMEANNLKMM